MKKKQQHDLYGKQVIVNATGLGEYQLQSGAIFAFGKRGGQGRIDATVGNDIAVEVESRVSKQVRGAVVDLILHPREKKLLLLLPVHMSNPKTTQRQCEYILRQFVDPDKFRVVALSGTGDDPHYADDTQATIRALAELGWQPSISSPSRPPSR